VLKSMVNEEFGSFNSQITWHEDELYPILQATIRDAETAFIVDEKYLEFFGFQDKPDRTVGDLLNHLLEKVQHKLTVDEHHIIEHILGQGTLSTRILRALNNDFSRTNIRRIYGQLGDCLAYNQLFNAPSSPI